MTPYRKLAAITRADPEREAARSDDRVLGVLMLGLGGLRMVIGLVQREQFGAEATIASIIACCGVLIIPWKRGA